MAMEVREGGWLVDAGHGNGSSARDDSRYAVEALTFDDVLLLPGFAEILPSEVDISTGWVSTSNSTFRS